METSSRRVALLTGGTRGIGLGIARCLADAGFKLALCGRRPAAEIEPVLAELNGKNCTAAYFRADISESAERARLLDEVRQHFGQLHVLVNNAGVAPRERNDLLEATEESFDWVLRINLRGPYFLTQGAARWMTEQKRSDPKFEGCVIFVSSVSATVASTNRGEYCISKAGLAMAAQLWAVRLSEFGIPVFEIRPGIIATDMTSGVRPKYDQMIEDGLLLQPRWGTPDDVGRAVRALATGAFPYSTGQVIVVDGGMLVDRL
jgi:NAD(P)-dependent dehydrogenase (short-subunit alcohol dehydrogenase family)